MNQETLTAMQFIHNIGAYSPGGSVSNGYLEWYQPTYYPSTTVWSTPTAPIECSGDMHVFPCPHCDKCKCGAATVKRQKAKK